MVIKITEPQKNLSSRLCDLVGLDPASSTTKLARILKFFDLASISIIQCRRVKNKGVGQTMWMCRLIWASSWDYGTYRIGDQRRLRRACAVSPEPSLFAHMKYGRRRRVRSKIRHLAPLDGCACTFNESTENEKYHVHMSLCCLHVAWNRFCHDTAH